MQRVGFLFEKVTTYENLLIAFYKSYKGKKNSEKEFFKFYLEKNLLELKFSLENNTYLPEEYTYFILKGLKNREISVAKFKDRVVQHSIINLLEPIFEKVFIFDSYATRKNKGVVRAIKRCQEMATSNGYFLKCDIEKYFDNIDHNILLQKIERKIKDKKLLHLIEKILKNKEIEKGLPIGNLTSQFFANVYLDSFDHFIKEKLKCKCYLRYMDDFVLLSKDKVELKIWKKEIDSYLEKNLKLKLKKSETRLNKVCHGISFCGVRIFPGTIRIRKESLKVSIYKIKDKIYNFKRNKISEEDLAMTLNSIFSYWKNYDTFNLRVKIIDKYLKDLGNY